MNAYPFSIFKRADRSCYSVSFKAPDGKYLRPVSTGKKTEDEAMKAAFIMLRDGIPQKKNALLVNGLSLKDTARKLKDSDEADILLGELKRLGWLKSFVKKETPGAEDLIAFLERFWDWDTSPYIEEKLRNNHGIHRRHCKQQKQAITLHWQPFFAGRFLGEITATDIGAFIRSMRTRKISGERKNVIIKAGLKALRWAYSKDMIERDPTRGHTLFSKDEAKRLILLPKDVAELFKIPWEYERAKIGNMLAAVTGMRLGEIQALRYKDLGQDCIFVGSSWNYEDGTKRTKNNEARTVYLPFPILIDGLYKLANSNPWGKSPDRYVFWSDYTEGKPFHGDKFLDQLRVALIKIGYSETEAKQYVFHGWRHFYTSYMIKHLDKKLLKSQTGHKTDSMLNLYSDHEIVGDKELIQNTGREVFAGLLPEPVLLLEYKGDLKTVAA